MEREEFYGVTLSEKEPLAQFEVDESDKYSMIEQKLIIKQICLGAEAKRGEFNVVQAETRVSFSGNSETLKIPIAVLKAGETSVIRPNLEFPSASVTFKLIQGTGPVHMCGQNVVTEHCEEVCSTNGSEEDEEDYDDEAPPPQTNGKNSNRKK